MVSVVAPYSKGVTEAAARGWEPISANFLLPQWVGSHWPKYVEGCRKGGRPADPANWRVAKSIFVADSDAKAREYVPGCGAPTGSTTAHSSPSSRREGAPSCSRRSRDMPDDAVTPDYVVDKLVIWGSPQKVADKLLAFREEVGDFGTLLYAGKDWVDPNLGRRSMVLMAEQVMPAVNAAIARGRKAAE